jgi:hypothetical protein
VKGQNGGLVAIFPDRGLRWQHFRGDGTTSSTQEAMDPRRPDYHRYTQRVGLAGEPCPWEQISPSASVATMTVKTDIRLLGFAGYPASERFLRSIDTDDAMRAELEQPSLVTVVSAHAGSWNGRLGFCGDGDQPVLMLGKLGVLGAASMPLIDACHAPALAAELKKAHARPGSLIVGLVPEPGGPAPAMTPSATAESPVGKQSVLCSLSANADDEPEESRDKPAARPTSPRGSPRPARSVHRPP